MPENKHKKTLPIILLAIFIDLLGNGVLVPIVPQLLANPSSDFYILSSTFPAGYAYVLLGVLIAVFPLCMFLSTPVLGEYSDYVGRKRVLVLAMGGAAIAMSIFAIGVMVKSIILLFAARIIGGILGGSVSVCQAAIADITPPEQRVKRFGFVGAAYGLGFILGPVIGGVLSSSSIVPWFSPVLPFWFVAFLSLTNATLMYFFFVETKTVQRVGKLIWNKAILNVYEAFKMRDVRFVFVTNFIFQSGLALCVTFFSVFLITKYGFTQTSVGYYIAYAGVWMIISQGVLLRIISRKLDEVSMLRIFLFLGSISILLYAFSKSVTSLLIVGALFALTNGINMASLPALVSRSARSDSQGEIMGINASVQALSHATPPLVAGLLASQIDPAAPVYIAGAIIFCSWIFFRFAVKRA